MMRGFDPDDPFDGDGDGDGGDPFGDPGGPRRGRHRRRGLRPTVADELGVDDDAVGADDVVAGGLDAGGRRRSRRVAGADDAADDGGADATPAFGARARELDAAGWDDAADAAEDAELVIGAHAGWRRFVTTGPLPVEGGIPARTRRGRIGATWWSQRFLSVIESLELGGRLDRGRNYARRGQVIRLEVQSGTVQADVQGSAALPYRVEIDLRRLAERDWARVVDALAQRASFCATLLAGEMPDDVEDAFVGARVGLFPASRNELATRCSCPDPVTPCKHIAAVLYLLAERFDDDPFALFAWRGRDRTRLLGELRARRSELAGASAQMPNRLPNRMPDGLGDPTGGVRAWVIGSGACARLADQIRPDAAPVLRPDPADFWEPVGPAPGQDSAGFSRWPPKA